MISSVPNVTWNLGTEKGLNIHIGRAHKSAEAPTPEKVRSDRAIEEPLLALISKHGTREEIFEAAYIDEDFNSTLINEVYENVPEEFPLNTSKDTKIPQKVELCMVWKFENNYCPLSRGCPMKTVAYPRNKTSEKMRKKILVGSCKLSL